MKGLVLAALLGLVGHQLYDSAATQLMAREAQQRAALEAATAR